MTRNTVLEQIVSLLNENHMDFIITEHKAVRTSEEAANVRGVDVKTGAKAMVVKSKDQFLLLVLPADKRINWKKIKAILEVKEIRFASEEEAEKVTHVEMGAVPPFGNILKLPTYFDESIQNIETVNFNPGSRTHSISMKSYDLISLVKPQIVSII